ncbi:MAG: PDZ domain-containing protein, partial [Ignavibacteriaceae bacterium]
MNIYSTLEVRVRSNDECLWLSEKSSVPGSAIIHFSLVKEGGVAWNAGIRNGDFLLKINNNIIKNANQAQAILDSVNYGEYANYVVRKKDGSILNTKVFVKKLIQFQALALGILGLIWMSIGFIVLMAKKGPIQKTFYVTGVAAVLSIAYLLIPQGIAPQNVFERILFISIAVAWTFGMSFFPFMIMYFFWIFPKPFKFIQHKWVKRIFWGIPSLLLTAIVLAIYFLVPRMKNSDMFFNILVLDMNLLLAASS